MEENDLELVKRLNRELLEKNFANATAQLNLEAIAIIGVLAGSVGFGLLIAILKWTNAVGIR